VPEPSAAPDDLSTDRLVLRPLRDSDLDGLAAIYADPLSRCGILVQDVEGATEHEIAGRGRDPRPRAVAARPRPADLADRPWQRRLAGRRPPWKTDAWHRFSRPAPEAGVGYRC
jgi:hypothetical protein